MKINTNYKKFILDLKYNKIIGEMNLNQDDDTFPMYLYGFNIIVSKYERTLLLNLEYSDDGIFIFKRKDYDFYLNLYNNYIREQKLKRILEL